VDNVPSTQPGSEDSPPDSAPLTKVGRLAIVATSFPPALGGAEVFMYQLSARLIEQGWQVHVLTALSKPWRPPGVIVESALAVSASKKPGAWLLYPLLWGLRRFSQRRTLYDLCLFSMVDPYLAAGGILRALHSFPPYVLRIASEANLDLLTHYRFSPLLRWSARRSVAIIVMNEHMADRLIGLGFEPVRIHIIPNGVDCALFHPPDHADAAWNRPPVVGCVSRLEPAKGTDVLLAAIRRAPSQWRWRIVGRGTLSDDMRRLAAENPNVHWVESLPRNSMPDFYRELDLFVLPSRDEGMSNALLEAMASGLPCVVSDIPANLPFEEAVVRIPPGDADRLLTVLSELASEPERRRGLGRSARACVEARFSMDRIAGTYNAVLRNAVAPGRPQSCA